MAITGAKVWCPGPACPPGVLFQFPYYRPVYRPEGSCARHRDAIEADLFRLGQAAYEKYRRSTPYLWVDTWEGHPWDPDSGITLGAWLVAHRDEGWRW